MTIEVSSRNKSYWKDYMLLIPKDAGIWGLIMLLSSKHIANRKFIDCPDGTVEERFSLRCVIFISVVLQKLLHIVYRPMGRLGSAIEYMANFVHLNGGFLKLLCNLISGKLMLPNKESVEFLSATGHDDIRRDLDNRIKPQDPGYTSALAIMAAKSAYENQAHIKYTVQKHWKMDFLGFFNCWNEYEEGYTTQCFMWSDKTQDSEMIGVSFRGTLPFNAKQWSSDIDLSWYDLPGIGKVHAGFLKDLGLQKTNGFPNDIQTNDQKPYAYYAIRQKLKDLVEKNPNAKFIVTGHSLGAALSALFPAILGYHNETDLLKKLDGVYTYGQPRVGDPKFCEYMTELLTIHGFKYHRFVYSYDLVPRVPFDTSDVYFKHFGDCHYFNTFYKGQVLIEEPNKNYFSILFIIPKYATAVWGLLRSFIIYYEKGPEFSETYTCRGLRFIGLLFPGLPDHGPQDYVNLTRLGTYT